ncbi:folliculin-interacting protein 2 isoform X2 [Rhizophagus clarus]|uniref:Folliculin-interacting protein 2 isoform X2 n=1 Tax=Rhizophagus clarus TaxID=94130 RepID=A0A8H3M8V4_9GLOM|nr:folliculin-interacting protein 2 isoform X2 [Rhizophagus clarus]
MLQKLFGTKPTKDVDDLHTRALLEPDSWSPPAFNSNQIRVILCQDTGDKTKLTLYDSAYTVASNSSDDRDRLTSELSSSWSGVGFFSGNFLQKSSSAINIKSNDPVNIAGHPPHYHHHILDNDNKRKSFDSINKSSIRTLPPSMNRNSHALFSQRKIAHNIDLIGEMMFGAVPLSYKGMTTKIHFIKSPKPQILLTKLFSINSTDFESNSPGRRSSFSSISSDTSLSSSTQGSIAINNESRNFIKQKCGSNPIYSDDYSESSDDESVRIIPTYPSSLFHHGPPILGLRTSGNSISSTSSLSTSPRSNFTNRRMRRYSQTSMENGIFNPTPLPGSTARLESLATRLDPLNTNSLSLKHPTRSMMYAIGVVITLEDNAILEEFIFSHFALLENRLHQLHSTAFRLLCHLLRRSPTPSSINGPNSIFNPSNKRFSSTSLPSLMLQNESIWLEAVMRFKTSLCQLYSTPRIQEPLWLNMSTFPQQRSKLAKSLLNELTFLLENFDNKKSNFFISTLISSVLMYHLAWVPTVAPISDFEERNGKNLFYDPLWAQLGDLYGSIGTSVMSRTIIVGKDKANSKNERNSNISSPGVTTQKLSSEKVVKLVDNLSENTEDSYKTKLLNVSNSQQTADNRDFTESLLEVPMPRSRDSFITPEVSSKDTSIEDDEPSSKKLPYRADELFVKSYGRSLMVGYCDTYMSDFVLMGLPSLDKFQESLDIDLKNSLMMQPLSSQDTISKSVCILGELDRLNCAILGYKTVTVDDHIFAPLHTSDYICSMLHRCKDLYITIGMPAESCLEYIEDHLRILYYKAVMYKKLFASSIPTSAATGTSPSIASPSIYTPPSSDDNVPLDVLDTIGLQESDIPLVKAVNSTF